MNPYLELLYRHLADEGYEPTEGGDLSFSWLWANRRRIDILHFNWPQGLYRYQRRPALLQRQLSWLKLIIFATRLAAARALGYRIVWTIHQVYPHDTEERRLDRAAARVLASAAHVLLVHDEPTRRTSADALGRRAAKAAVVPHGSYVGVYPRGRARELVRAELGIDQSAFLFLCFGELRKHKETSLVLRAFDQVATRDVALLVAGHPKSADAENEIVRAAERDSRIKHVLRFIPDAQVRELFDAADAAVIARSDGGTSGALVLALSLDLPVVVADRPAYRELTRDGDAGWLFEPRDAGALSAALTAAAADRDEAALKGRAAGAIAAQLAWPSIAATTGRLLDATLR